MERKLSLTMNVFLRGSENFFGVYYSHIVHDSFTGNNEGGLNSLGLRIVF